MEGLIKALAHVQKELKAPKSQFNKFGNYSYRSCEDILNAVKKVIPESYAVIIEDEIVQVGDRYYIRATAKFTNGTEIVESVALAREPLQQKGMSESQVTGTASSYARKYSLNALFMIDDVADADTMDNRPQNQPSQPTNRPQNAPNVNANGMTRPKCPLCNAGPEKVNHNQYGEGFYCFACKQVFK